LHEITQPEDAPNELTALLEIAPSILIALTTLPS
jgi:hypothetical protein